MDTRQNIRNGKCRYNTTHIGLFLETVMQRIYVIRSTLFFSSLPRGIILYWYPARYSTLTARSYQTTDTFMYKSDKQE